MGLSVVGAGIACSMGTWSTIPYQTSCFYFCLAHSANQEYIKSRNAVDCMRGCLVPCCAVLHQSQRSTLCAQSYWEYPLIPAHDLTMSRARVCGFYFGQTHYGVRPYEPVLRVAYEENTPTMAVNRTPVRLWGCLSRVEWP